MKIKYFIPLVLEVKVSHPRSALLVNNAVDHEFEDEMDEIKRKIDVRIEEYLIYWAQTNGIEVTARFTK